MGGRAACPSLGSWCLIRERTGQDICLMIPLTETSSVVLQVADSVLARAETGDLAIEGGRYDVANKGDRPGNRERNHG